MTTTVLSIGRYGLQFARKFMLSGTRNFSTVRYSPIMSSSDRLVWIDMEMTGLNPNVDHIMEVACVITDGQLNEILGDFERVIHLPDEILDNMNDWCKSQHAKTGLTEECRTSTLGIQDAEAQLLNFVTDHVPKGVCPLAGNSVYMDRVFLMKYMPYVNDYLHYRLVDVSTIKELSKRWTPRLVKTMSGKSYNHRGLQDIYESIEELRFYKKNFFDAHELSTL